jgi:hypothetical protein
MSLEILLVISGCLLPGLLVIGRPVRGRRRLITLAVFGAGIVAVGLGFRSWRKEKSRGIVPELALAVRVPIAAELPHQPTLPAPENPAGVDLTYFAGTWKNVKTPVRGLTKLRVRTQGESLWVHAWEKCHPTDCDWGEAPGSAVKPENSSDARTDVQKVTATFQTSFTETTMTLTPAEENTLEAGTQTRFTDNSGRSSYSTTYTFRH